jgi:hypothetical protein
MCQVGAQPVTASGDAPADVQHALALGARGFQQDDPLARTDLDELLAQPGTEVRNVELIGYADLDGRPGFKLALQVVGERWYLYVGHLWHRGWSVLDVTNPAHPRLERFWPGPDNTWTIQMQAADGRLMTALERMPPGWGGDASRPHAETAIVWDASDPTAPVELSRIGMGGSGSHRNFWAGGQYAYMAANPGGYAGNIVVVMDLADPAQPREAGRWWIDGQAPGETLAPHEDGVSVHGPAYVIGDRCYVSYGGAGMVILDVSNPRAPRFVSRFDVSPPFKGGFGGAGVHTVLPFPERGIAIVNGETHAEMGREELSFAGVVDIRDEEHPRLVSIIPQPRPSPGMPFGRNYADKGGRFGPHNSHLSHHQPWYENRSDLLYLTWFNAGLRIYDTSDPRQVEEIGHFVPPNPQQRRGLFPQTALVAQTEDVLVDSRGYIYITDKNHGIFVLKRRQP